MPVEAKQRLVGSPHSEANRGLPRLALACLAYSLPCPPAGLMKRHSAQSELPGNYYKYMY